MKHLWSSGNEGAPTCMRAACGRARTDGNADADDCGAPREIPPSFNVPEGIGASMRAHAGERLRFLTGAAGQERDCDCPARCGKCTCEVTT